MLRFYDVCLFEPFFSKTSNIHFMISMSYGVMLFFRLVALVEVLQKRKLKHNKRPQSQPHSLENITIALDAIQEDGIKLVNIGEFLQFLLKPFS